MASHKKQHYIPQFILRNFSKDKTNISAFLLKSGDFKDSIPLKFQCQENYFYGQDGNLEHAFANGIENTFSTILGNCNLTSLEMLSEHELKAFKLFVWYQYNRTPGAANQISKCFERPMSELFGTPVTMQNAQILTVETAYHLEPAIHDLEVKFILNETPEQFVISDHPVVLYNQWIENHPQLKESPFGLGSGIKGAQFFFPISPTICVALFDPQKYQYGNSSSRICKTIKHDISYLNRLQFLNGQQCIYLSSLDHPSIKDVLTKYSIQRNKSKSLHQTQIGAKFSFVTPFDERDYSKQFPSRRIDIKDLIRNPDLADKLFFKKP